MNTYENSLPLGIMILLHPNPAVRAAKKRTLSISKKKTFVTCAPLTKIFLVVTCQSLQDHRTIDDRQKN